MLERDVAARPSHGSNPGVPPCRRLTSRRAPCVAASLPRARACRGVTGCEASTVPRTTGCLLTPSATRGAGPSSLWLVPHKPPLGRDPAR